MMMDKPRLTSSIQTLPPEQVAREQATDAGGMYPKTRLISTTSATVVRQDDADGPRYQEALGYTFLFNDAKFPSVVRMDDGRLALALEYSTRFVSQEPEIRNGVILFSEDEGLSWSQPRRIPILRCSLVNLGGARIMLRGYLGGGSDVTDRHGLIFSEDGGETWSEPEEIPLLPDGCKCNTDVALNPLVEGDTVTFMFYYNDPPGTEDYWSGGTFIRRFHVDSHKWDDAVFLPKEWHSNEGALTRAANGDLVASFRTDLPDIAAMAGTCDHWSGISTSRSTDNGKTWSDPVAHLFYGHVHQSLLRLPDGRILMTYAARIGELEGRTYHGIEAVVSSDDGASWNMEHRYILFRGPDRTMHSPQSALLADNRILTVFFHPMSFTWNEGERTPSSNLINLGNVSVVIWTPSEI